MTYQEYLDQKAPLEQAVADTQSALNDFSAANPVWRASVWYDGVTILPQGINGGGWSGSLAPSMPGTEADPDNPTMGVVLVGGTQPPDFTFQFQIPWGDGTYQDCTTTVSWG